MNGKRLALVVYADPRLLPPTLNAAQVLSERGWRVDLLGLGEEGVARELSAGLELRLHAPVRAGLGYHVGYLQFLIWACRLARRERYQWIYAYDMAAAPIGHAMAMAAGARWIYHNHDLATDASDMTRSQRWLGYKWRELASARRAELVVFPQAHRAKVFATQAHLDAPPAVVFNCPSLGWGRERDLDPGVVRFRQTHPRLVVYQGGINRDRGAFALVDSLPYWPSDRGLVLAGADDSGEAIELKRRCEMLGQADRVLWMGRLAYEDLPTVTAAGVLGAMLTPPNGRRDFNLEYMAGASVKVFDYMACGLAVLAPDTPGFRELVEVPGHGEVCRDHSPRAMAAQITRLSEDSEENRAIRNKNRLAFQTRYHYEHQLKPVIELIDGLQPQH
jgi:glycosyltransferase involved in cell wall biosynthesis